MSGLIFGYCEVEYWKGNKVFTGQDYASNYGPRPGTPNSTICLVVDDINDAFLPGFVKN